MLRKFLIAILLTKLAGCENAPVGDFCDVYQYPADLGCVDVGMEIFECNESWGDKTLANKEYYEIHCIGD